MSWREKFSDDDPGHNKVVEIPAKMQPDHGQGTMIISTPRTIDAIVREVPEGKVVTVADLMARLARDAGTNTACPMNTGIFLRIVAECAELDRAEGKAATPYWRVLKNKGRLNAKYPGGVFAQAKLLEAEGHILARNAHGAPARIEAIEGLRHSL
jgi:alkylated DNA nucleotide flippase Atl1